MQAAIAGAGFQIDVKSEKAANKSIEKQLAKDAKIEENTIRILVLGTGDSGKSTFIKQMLLTHLLKNPFLPAQITGFKKALKKNALESFEVLCNVYVSKKTGNKQLTEEAKKFLPVIKKAISKEDLSPELAKEISTFWANKEIKDLFVNRASSVQIHTSTPYYLDNVLRFADPNFSPDPKDILHCRERTSGVHETLVQAEGLYIRFIDVGGQRAERRKWLSCFSSCTLVIYVCALDSYSKVLEEDGKTNRLTDSLACFKEISGHKHLQNIPFQVFLNKHDVYHEVWQTNKISEFFPECKVKQEDDGIRWISSQFEANYKGSDKSKFMTPLITTVLDQKNIAKIWAVCRGIIVGGGLEALNQEDFIET